LIYNPRDRAALVRVMQRTPGVGKQTLARLAAWADEHAVDCVSAAAQAERIAKLPKPAVRALVEFARTMADFAEAAYGPVEPLLRLIDERTGYSEELRAGGTEQDEQRLANVEELRTAAAQFDREHEAEASLEGFLETTSLASDLDRLEGPTGAVTLMTLHAAKGLEFPVVYIVGVEHGLIPHERSLRENDPRELEEERRLLFVGMTRAKEELCLTQTSIREFRGSRHSTIPSEFLAETDFVVDDCRSFVGYFEPPVDFAAPRRPHRERERPAESPHRPRLTTAAALLEGNGEEADMPLGFAVGMSVRHPQYGLGRVVEVSGLSKRRMVTVEFEQDDRTQTFVAAKCPLQPVAVR
jgi:DNA helicase-2/ATP-dependent DNA helicase PcrA